MKMEWKMGGRGENNKNKETKRTKSYSQGELEYATALRKYSLPLRWF